MSGYRLSAAAQDDLLGLLAWTEAHHGTDARKRYQGLIVVALRGIATRPDRADSGAQRVLRQLVPGAASPARRPAQHPQRDQRADVA